MIAWLWAWLNRWDPYLLNTRERRWIWIRQERSE